MSAPVSSPPTSQRLMIFEVAGHPFALPISEVLEVVEQSGVRCIPTLSKSTGGVMNWHGEALPVIASHLLLGGDAMPERGADEVQPFLVVSDRPDGGRQLGLPIDHVCGLVNGERGRPAGNEVVVERRTLDGRVVSLVNPQRLVAQAEEVIERNSSRYPSGAGQATP
ncbi:MAG: chemotaxis protein CheW [Myxococcota bacterium]|nr:chemotaxis protein CheW [Myxococcota bacterium]